MELILFMLFWGIVTAIVAAAKRRIAPLWFFAGCIFGVFATIIVAVLPKVQDYPPPPQA